MVDCSKASSKDCHHAQHAANAFDTEKVALMHSIFQMLQTPPGKAPTCHSPCILLGRHACCEIEICVQLSQHVKVAAHNTLLCHPNALSWIRC